MINLDNEEATALSKAFAVLIIQTNSGEVVVINEGLVIDEEKKKLYT